MQRRRLSQIDSIKTEWILLAGIIAMAAFLRFWRLTSIPPGYHFDEAFEGLEAWHLLQDPTYRPLFFTGNFGVEPMFIYLTALAFHWFGAGPTVQRGVAALIGLLTVPAVWLLAHEIRRWQPRLPTSFPLWSTAVQAGLFWAISASRIGYEPGLVPLLLCPLLWALLRALRTQQPLAWLLAGVLTGLGPYTYPAGRLFFAVTPAILVITLVTVLWARRRHAPPAASAPPAWPARRWFVSLALLTGAALLVCAPLALAWLNQPELLLLRSRQIAVVAEGAGSASPFAAIFDHLLAVLGMFSFAGDADPRNNIPARPIFDWFLAPYFYLGLALTLWRWRERLAAPLLGALAIMLAPTVLSEYAPHFRRALGALPLVSLFTGMGLAAAWCAVQAWLHGRPRAVLIARLGIVASLAISSGLSARAYFVRWANSPDLFYAFDEGLWQLAHAISALPDETQVLLTPRPASHTTLAFAWRNEDTPLASFDGRRIFIVPPDRQRPIVYAVIETEDFRSRLLLPEVFPTAHTIGVIQDRQQQLFASLYRIAPGVEPIIAPQQRSDALWNGQARLVGFNLEPVYRPGHVIYLRLFWQAQAPITEDWTFFAHLLDADGHNVLGADGPPGAGSFPTSRWLLGARRTGSFAPHETRVGVWIIDETQIAIPAALLPGDYTMEIGFYRASGERIPVQADGRSDTRILLGALRIEETP